MKKIVAIVLVLAMTMAVSSGALAATYSYLQTTSASGGYLHTYVVRGYNGFSLSGSNGSGSGSIDPSSTATKLTVRPYYTDAAGEDFKLSNAKTYEAGALTSGQTYWSRPVHLHIKANNNSEGNLIKINGLWKF